MKMDISQLALQINNSLIMGQLHDTLAETVTNVANVAAVFNAETPRPFAPLSSDQIVPRIDCLHELAQ